MKTTIVVKQGQLALLKKKDEYIDVLTAGEHKFFDFGHKLSVDIFPLNGGALESEKAEFLRQYYPQWVTEYGFDIVLSDEEIGLLYENGSLKEILAPGTRRLYWRYSDRSLEIVSIDELEVSSILMKKLQHPKLRNQVIKGSEGVLTVDIPAWHAGVIRINGETQALLPPGLKGYWRYQHKVDVEVVDMRLQTLDVSGQEILTKDKVTLRINLSANWRYSDVLLAYQQLASPLEFLYKELQFALREAVGTRTLDELLENKSLIDSLVSEKISEVTEGYGIEVASLGVKDIVLPGEMKTILAQVVEAEKSAQANVIRRREETSATRSLLNTAKVMENNPVALRLKELETVERIAERIDKISVYGGLDQVLNGLVQIKGAQA
ncbi:slipin family protein [Proteus vulgaris]|uniref:Slipin family protein n=1 Tax=Proteus vulgaris TaxID=585 RepID=A0A6G6SSP5_PROVU|nr:slipin family protein [Proteus vulgaris]QIF96069.1 slipin family protein [Proteus vulgaris]